MPNFALDKHHSNFLDREFAPIEGAILLRHEYVTELLRHAKHNNQTNFIVCDDVEEVVSLIENGKANLALVDVSLSENWPASIASRLCEIASHDVLVIIICNDNKADERAIQMYCKGIQNVFVTTDKRSKPEEIFDLCLSLSMPC